MNVGSAVVSKVMYHLDTSLTGLDRALPTYTAKLHHLLILAYIQDRYPGTYAPATPSLSMVLGSLFPADILLTEAEIVFFTLKIARIVVHFLRGLVYTDAVQRTLV